MNDVLEDAARAINERNVDEMELYYSGVYSQPGVLLRDVYGNPNAPLGLLLESFRDDYELEIVLRRMLIATSISPSASYVYTYYPLGDGSNGRLTVTTPLSHIIVLDDPIPEIRSECFRQLVDLGANPNDEPFCHHPADSINREKRSILYTTMERLDRITVCLYALLDLNADFNSIWDPVDLFFHFRIDKLWNLLLVLARYTSRPELPPIIRMRLQMRNPENGQTLLHVLFGNNIFIINPLFLQQVIRMLLSSSRTTILSMFTKDMNGVTPLDLAQEMANSRPTQSNNDKLEVAEGFAYCEHIEQQYNRAASDLLQSKNIPLELIKRSDVDFGRAAEAAHAIRSRRIKE